MLHFHCDRKPKYALEALRLQLQLASLDPYLAHQLKWERFVNTHGGIGHNIPCDLHNEHINKKFKEVITSMGANFTESASTRIARSVSSLENVTNRFAQQTGIHRESSAHTHKSDVKDVKIVASVLTQTSILTPEQGRTHSNFQQQSPNPLQKLDRVKLNKWIEQKTAEYTKFNDSIAQHVNTESETEDVLDF